MKAINKMDKINIDFKSLKLIISRVEEVVEILDYNFSTEEYYAGYDFYYNENDDNDDVNLVIKCTDGYDGGNTFYFPLEYIFEDEETMLYLVRKFLGMKLYCGSYSYNDKEVESEDLKNYE